MNKTKYSLYATFVHQGKANTGHYWVNVKFGDKWYRMDDMEVRNVE